MPLELSLYQIEQDLRDLLDMREDAMDENEVSILDAQIKEYVRAEVRKVDGIRAYWRHAETMAICAEEEAKRQAERARAWKSRLSRLKTMCAQVMEDMTWREGKPRKLEGETGSLLLKANGGRPAVEILNTELVPLELHEVTVKMSASTWAWAQRVLSENEEDIPFTAEVSKPVPSIAAIFRAIEKEGGCPGARLAPRGNHVECR